MANRVDIKVGVSDETKAGNASVVSGAEQVRLTLDQKHAAMLAAHKAAEEKFARDNAAIFLDVEHEKYARVAEEFAQLQERNRRAAEKFVETSTKPLTPAQQQAGEAARAIIQQAPPPVVQRIVNDVEQHTPQQPASLVQRVVTDAEPHTGQQLPPIVQRVVNDVDRPPVVAQPAPIVQQVETKPVGERDIATGAKHAQAAMDELRTRTESLTVAFRELNQSGLQNIGAGGLERLKGIADELRELRAGAKQTAAVLRDIGKGEGGAPLAGFADAVDHEIAQSVQAIGRFEQAVARASSRDKQSAAEFATAERAKQVEATKTANIIDEVRDQQRMASERRAEAATRAFVQSEHEQQQATQKTATIVETVRTQGAGVFGAMRTEVEQFKKSLLDSGLAADSLTKEMKSIDFPPESLNEARELAAQIDKTRQAAILAEDAFEAMGQTEFSDRIRAGLNSTEGATRRLRAAINEAGVRELANEMQQAGNTAQHMSGGLDKSGQAARRLKTALADMGIPKLTAEMNRVEAAARGAAGTRSANGQGIMQLAYAADDLQYGMRGIVNNIPGLLMSLGAGAGLAGVVSIAAVAISVLLPKLEELGEKLSKDGFAKTASDGVEALTQKYRKLELTLKELAQPIQATNDAAANNQAGIDAIKKEIAEYERLGAVKAAQKAIGDGLKENAEKAGDRASERAREELDTIIKVEARMKGLQAYIDEQGGNGLHAIDPDSVEKVKGAVTELGKLEALKERIAVADAKKKLADADTKADASYKREADAREAELKSLDQIDARLRDIETLKKGKSTGVAGAYDLDEKSLKRITAEEESLKNKRASETAAMAERLRENNRLATESVERSREQSAELEKQAALANALHDIEQRRAAVTSGADDSRAEASRQQSEARRDAFLDRVKTKTELARAASEKANADESLSDTQRQQKRDAYNAAVMSQITAEANTRKQKADDQNTFEQSQIAKNAALDRQAIAVRQAAVTSATEELAKARAADDAADKDHAAGADERRKKATSDLAKAENEKLKAEADLTKQVESNETRRRDAAEKNQQQHTKQRIADEIAVGKAREQALIDAAAREQAIEDAKKAKLQDGLQQNPQVKQVAERIDDKIDDREVVKQAIQDRRNKAERDFRAQKMEAGEAVKPGEVEKVKNQAGRDFIKDNREGKADAELAEIRKKFFDGFVNGARGLNDAQRAALKALAGEAANKIIDDAGVKNAAGEIVKAKPEDKAAAKRNRTREEIAADDVNARNERRAEKGLAPQGISDEDLAKLNKQRQEKKLPVLKKQEPAEPRDDNVLEPAKKTAEEIKTEAAKKAAEQKNAHDELTAKRIATRKAAEEKKQREQDRKDAEVEANVADVEEKKRLEAETPEQRIAREQREDDEFRQQRADERDAAAEAANAKMTAAKPVAESLAVEQQAEEPKQPRMTNAKEYLRDHPEIADEKIDVKAVADTEEADRKLDALTEPRVVNVRVEVEQQQPLENREAIDKIKVEQGDVPPLTDRNVTDTIDVSQQPREPLTGQQVTDVVAVEQQNPATLADRSSTDVVAVEQQSPTPLVDRTATDRVSVDQAQPQPLADRTATDAIDVDQQPREPLAGQTATDRVTVEQPSREPLKDRTATDTIRTKREPVQFADPEPESTEPEPKRPLFFDEPDALGGAAGNDEITVEADTSSAEADISRLTQPRTVRVTAEVTQPPANAAKSTTETPDLAAQQTGQQDHSAALTAARDAIERGPQPDPNVEIVAALRELTALVSQQANQNQAGPVVAAVRDLTAATRKLGEAQERFGSTVVDGLNATASLDTDLANRQEQFVDVVDQITDHINGLQSKMLAQTNTISTRALRAGAV